MSSRRLIANQQCSGERLDACLARLQPLQTTHGRLSRGAYAALIEAGRVLLNGRPASPRVVLKAGDRLEVGEPLPDGRPPLPDALTPRVLFEDEGLIAVDKPAGLPVHRAPGVRTATLADWLAETRPAIRGIGEDPSRPGIVHRLDKDTSGVMVVAKTADTYWKLKALFHSREIAKTYLALVAGTPKDDAGVITAPLSRSPVSGRLTALRPGQAAAGRLREAETAYAVLERFPEGALLEVRPRTGRTHQIRVHLASIGHPIAGDRLYRQKISSQAFPETPPRHLLHAAELTFTLDGTPYAFEAPLPADFSAFLARIRSGDQ